MLRIQGRTRFFVSEIVEAVGGIAVWVCIQQAGGRISRELRREALPGGRSTRPDASSALGIHLFEARESLLEPERVCGPDGKDSHTALRTACPTQEMGAASDGGIGKSAVDQSDKAPVLVSELCIRLIRVWVRA